MKRRSFVSAIAALIAVPFFGFRKSATHNRKLRFEHIKRVRGVDDLDKLRRALAMLDEGLRKNASRARLDSDLFIAFDGNEIVACAFCSWYEDKKQAWVSAVSHTDLDATEQLMRYVKMCCVAYGYKVICIEASMMLCCNHDAIQMMQMFKDAGVMRNADIAYVWIQGPEEVLPVIRMHVSSGWIDGICLDGTAAYAVSLLKRFKQVCVSRGTRFKLLDVNKSTFPEFFV